MVAARQFDEPVMTLAEAAGWLERRFGKRPNVASVWRWATRGVKGVKLATISLGRYRYTTASALEHFIAETSQVVVGRKAAITTQAAGLKTPGFTACEVTAAKQRREAEKARAKAFLNTCLRPGTSRRNTYDPPRKSGRKTT